MATVYMNGFEWNSYYENILSWSGVDIVDDYPLSGNYCLSIEDSQYMRFQTPEIGEFYMQIGFKPINNGPHDGNQIKWYAGSTLVGMISFNPFDQKISVHKGNRTVTYGTSTDQLLFSQWYYIEVYIKLDVTNGVIQLKIDGQTQFTFSGSTTPGATTVSLFYLLSEYVSGSGLYSPTHYYVDDIVINDTTGVNNTSWPNGAKIVLLFPTGRGYSTQWEKMAHLDNYENVDNYPTLDPVDYLLTNLNEQLDLYMMNDLPSDAFSVGAARIDAWALKNSGSDLMLNLALRTGGATFLSENNELGVSYALEQWLHQINPGTSVNWTVANINDLEAGMRSNIPE
jgi:hypothetical protein